MKSLKNIKKFASDAPKPKTTTLPILLVLLLKLLIDLSDGISYKDPSHQFEAWFKIQHNPEQTHADKH